MRGRTARFLMASVAVLTFSEAATACHTCHKTPCVLAPAPAPAYQCVTEMVPYTVYRQRTRTEFRPVTETIMVRVPETTYVERQRTICKPVWDTTYEQRVVNVCRPVTETTVVNQEIAICKPVTTTRQVTEYCMQPTTTLVTVPVAQKCGHCGKVKPSCTCQVVAQTCYTPVPVVRDVVETQMVREVEVRPIKVFTTHIEREQKVVNVPIRHCRMVQEVVTERIPHTTFHCEPKTITRQVPYPSARPSPKPATARSSGWLPSFPLSLPHPRPHPWRQNRPPPRSRVERRPIGGRCLESAAEVDVLDQQIGDGRDQKESGHRRQVEAQQGDASDFGFEFVRQAKSGGSCQLRGTDHGNCSFAMKLAGGVTGDRAVEARRCDDVSRNAKA